MSHISAIFGTDDDQEILNSLYLIANVCYYGSLDWFLTDSPADRTQSDSVLFTSLSQYTILHRIPEAGLLGPIATLRR